VEKLTDFITPLAESLNLEPMVLDGGADARIERVHDALLERLCVAVERLVQQGEPQAAPEQPDVVTVSVLNARHTPILTDDPVGKTMAAALDRLNYRG
jgi:hypothetical protein